MAKILFSNRSDVAVDLALEPWGDVAEVPSGVDLVFEVPDLPPPDLEFSLGQLGKASLHINAEDVRMSPPGRQIDSGKGRSPSAMPEPGRAALREARVALVTFSNALPDRPVSLLIDPWKKTLLVPPNGVLNFSFAESPPPDVQVAVLKSGNPYVCINTEYVGVFVDNKLAFELGDGKRKSGFPFLK